MTKKEAIGIISKCAKLYNKHLENQQVVFVYRDSNNHSAYTAVQFRSHNFLHFTGVTPRKGLNANNFYRYALNSKMSMIFHSTTITQQSSSYKYLMLLCVLTKEHE